MHFIVIGHRRLTFGHMVIGHWSKILFKLGYILDLRSSGFPCAICHFSTKVWKKCFKLQVRLIEAPLGPRRANVNLHNFSAPSQATFVLVFC